MSMERRYDKSGSRYWWRSVNKGRTYRCVKLYSTADQASLLADIFEVVAELKRRGKKLAAVSSSPWSTIAPTLKKYDVEELFDVFVTADDVDNKNLTMSQPSGRLT